MTLAAFGALALLIYTYAGYPLLALLWSRLAPRGVARRSDFEPTVSVCIAVHDGERYLEEKLRSLDGLAYPREKIEILLCSDGSTDGTEERARALAERDTRIRVFSLPRRSGKPSALNLLRREARGDVLLMTDVRQRLAPPALRALLEPLADPEVGCVSGTLVLAGETGPSAYWRYEYFIRSCEARRGSMVGVSGSLYAVRRGDFDELPADVLLDDMFVPLSLVRSQKRTVLSPEAVAYDEACDDEREFGRKVRTLAGNYQLLAKMPWLLLPGKNGVWFELVSHKLLRLACPWALVLLFWMSGVLAFDARLGAAAALGWRSVWLLQLLFYALALLGPRAGRVGVVARTFVVLNAAAVVGLWRFLAGSQAVTW
ncbi:MAG TPA: glycosyltransferase family 2 protein [Polyangiaceae bacterium]|nr:glycosyltransferase family 2 protein [Polyangiaceae bacterium]